MTNLNDAEKIEFCVSMGFDAMRICMGLPTKNHPPTEVLRWMRLMTKKK